MQIYLKAATKKSEHQCMQISQENLFYCQKVLGSDLASVKELAKGLVLVLALAKVQALE